jgi:predicted ATPase
MGRSVPSPLGPRPQGPGCRLCRQSASVVLLSGEPGIGKSRLTVALEEQLQTEQHTPLRYFCSPMHTDSTLYPFISQLERAAGFKRNDRMAAKLDKLSSLLGASPNHDNDVQLLAELLTRGSGPIS